MAVQETDNRPLTTDNFVMAETQKDKLKKMIAWDAEPTLTETEVDDLLAGASVIDKSGLKPTDTDWDATYDLNAAAANGWLIKAAQAASLVAVDPPDSGIVTSKVFDNCRAMAREYAKKRAGTVSTSSIG